jgi:hypothetical protein
MAFHTLSFPWPAFEVWIGFTAEWRTCGLPHGLSWRMSFSHRDVLTMILFSALASLTSASLASPLLPCIAATLSANGNILVVNKLTNDDPEETHARRPQTSTFLVLRRNVDIIDGLRLKGPNAYWTDPIWSVVFTNSSKPPLIACPYTLVTDDGEYLILVGDFFVQDALSIYRRRDHPGRPFGGPGPDHGLLVRQIPLRDLWAPEHIPEGIFDGTPQWFEGGTFAFSPDNRTLLHKTRWGKTLQINLETGKVTSQ